MNIEKPFFINEIRLKDDIKPSLFDTYPLNISALNLFVSLRVDNPVLIFNGDNGCGKSTILEGIADILDIPLSGGNKNLSVLIDENIQEEKSELSKYLLIDKGYKKPYRSFFFRAESFSELAKVLDNNDDINKDNYSSRDLTKQSHGQSFIDLITHQFIKNSLYILDEPESALSPKNQINLINIINKLSKEGTQFIIATHSPLLLGIKNARIINLDNGMRNIRYEDTTAYKTYKEFLLNPNKFQE